MAGGKNTDKNTQDRLSRGQQCNSAFTKRADEGNFTKNIQYSRGKNSNHFHKATGCFFSSFSKPRATFYFYNIFFSIDKKEQQSKSRLLLYYLGLYFKKPRVDGKTLI